MRQNLPVTQRERTFTDAERLISTTDLNSKITYVNDAFVSISGYSREELVGQPHNYSEQLLSTHGPARPRVVKQAIDLLEQQPEEPWTISELSRAIGVSARTLQSGFQRYVGVSPTTYLREVRLQRVHAELCNPEVQTSVSDSAFRWGFTHLGRFAAAYRNKFGETPSETLRNREPQSSLSPTW